MLRECVVVREREGSNGERMRKVEDLHDMTFLKAKTTIFFFLLKH